ncbi:MAG: hypothetical protein LLG06_16145 [Desulfobacteraceae bacterium]|nr:hypothetical protein [Desulfobacteraceae bacterium]
MEIPVYVTVEEVKRVCRALGIRDWTEVPDAKVLPEEARIILNEIETDGMAIDPDSFRQGLEVELEHGVRYASANVTNNHPLLTGKIVLAHLKETLDYYDRLEVAELEGDILKAAVAGNEEKLLRLYKKLLHAKLVLGKVECSQATWPCNRAP